MILRSLTVLSALLASPAVAQVQPVPGPGDPHLQTIDYQAGQIVQLRAAPGFQLMVELSPDEQVQSVALGDTSSWQVNVNKTGDRLFLKATQPGGITNMTVVTSVRVYNFELYSADGPTPDAPYTVQFRYPTIAADWPDPDYVDVSRRARQASRFKIGGDHLLRPMAVTDDGQHTYIQWPRTAPIPAIYTVDSSGRETLVNGMMGTDDVYVVDGAQQLLTFRVDDNLAYARRIERKKPR